MIVRLMSPLTVEFRHADGISSSSREAHSVVTCAGIARTASRAAIATPCVRA